MKKMLAALTVCSVFAAAPSFAQSAAPSAPAAASDPAAVAAAHAMFEAMHYRDVAGGILAQMSQSMPDAFAKGASVGIDNNPKLTAAQKKAAHDKLIKDLPKITSMMRDIFNDPGTINDMVSETEALYARHFTADELNQIAAFYRTPVGTKMLSIMPQLTAEAMQIGQRVVMPRVTAVVQKLQAQ